MTKRPTRGLTTYLFLMLVLSLFSIGVAHALKPTDPLDPNDCSRGIDESNQETCNLAVSQ